MSLSRFLAALDELVEDATRSLASVDSTETLEALRVKFVGAKNGALKSVQKLLASVEVPDKPAAGKRFNEVRDTIQAALDAAATGLGGNASTHPSGPKLDPTLPGLRPRLGQLHPITQTIEHLKEIMGRLGFSVTEGPEIEDTWHNFVALNIPEDHPARDPLDNFYLATANKQAASDHDAMLLRSQTSTVQIRVMESQPLPLRIISLGRVYRPDAPDATHFPMFHQMEGLWVDKHVTMAQLKSVLRLFATSYLGSDVNVRFRPSFFPFTEPSVEVDYWWNGQWIEFGGAGMVDPNVFAHLNIDPEQYSGFAFGLGVERLCMRRFGITDIRDLYRSDVRFLRQFAS
ncbi:Phenylalanine--tRNA ligase alpha subunit [Pirellula sp. SH-Sr6A]|uniref:phenylalanine--tRNA ligase subunit alpha n=1 Tax=Pirellula sp. SH-Sr6A TaxID=1632865 RepID=UPI00078C4322|nr:phenylalanine--tRNA ligase subunit alpha [Pirellula sp. SH-Sr6A]AMV34882.1 Phenylalanine--tRNA ligase alpha subunit [Pirellula sp. SH-Sr6A]